ncbi:MAG: hypothetical protein MAG451_01630 [Anaerolineales bacterium]|nr:hypothetical protein [Anaerolineales bacterium]
MVFPVAISVEVHPASDVDAPVRRHAVPRRAFPRGTDENGQPDQVPGEIPLLQEDAVIKFIEIGDVGLRLRVSIEAEPLPSRVAVERPVIGSSRGVRRILRVAEVCGNFGVLGGCVVVEIGVRLVARHFGCVGDHADRLTAGRDDERHRCTLTSR